MMKTKTKSETGDRDGHRSSSRRSATQTLIALVGALALTFGAGVVAAAAETPDGAEAVAVVHTTPAAVEVGDPPADPPADQAQENPAPAAPAAPPAGPQPQGDLAESPDAAPAEESAETETETLEPEMQMQSMGVASIGEKSQSKGKTHDKKDRDKGDKITLCHSIGQDKGWVTKSLKKKDAVAEHAGWRHQNDIIPPFSYKDGWKTINFPGQNWNAQGQAIWSNDCQKPQPTIDVGVVPCTVPGGEVPATVQVSLGNLSKGKTYNVRIDYEGSHVSSLKLVAYGPTAQVDMSIAGPGDFYTASVTQKGSKTSTSTDFQVPPCPPPPAPELAIAGAADQCVALGGNGSVIVTISGLLTDGVYVVTLEFGGELIGTQTVEHPEHASAMLTFAVSEFGDYTAHVTGQESAPVALRTVEVPVPVPAQSASVVFRAGEGCSVPPVTPAALQPMPPALVSTGSAGSPDAAALLVGGLIVALGGAMVINRRIWRLFGSR